MSKPTFTLTLTLAQFNALASRLKDKGYDSSSLEGGTLPELHGVVLSYAVQSSPDTATVTFTIEKKPWAISSGLIEREVKNWIGC